MNVTIIYDTTKKTTTYNCVQLLLNNLRLTMTIHVTEFFLPKDLPSFCGSFPCRTINSENILLHWNSTDYITDSLDNSDLIILAYPVSECDITTNMKLLLNHLYYKYIVNNTSSFMKNKIGLVISTATGAGLFHSTKTLKRNLNFLGIHNICEFSKTFYELNWNYVTFKKKLKINKKIFKLSNKIINLYLSKHTTKVSIKDQITSAKTKPTFKTNHSNVLNFRYQRKHSYPN